ncbi:hypothetical protein OIU74_011742 [Salix koriyanagi]|uniref:RING-type domain-containing protein n=1 Tax=Salix koriyanagi TaxID=2511006 RepID=A0A9Q0TG27_9ROSI|nr:hypothetical protein OIU74_011742 [Salix koriyanagi]
MARLLGDLRPQISRHNSTRFPVVDPTQSDENDFDPSALEGTTRLGTALAEERLLSAREAVAAQEAAEAAAQAEAAAAAASEQETEEGAMPMPGNMETQEPVRMSLMDLLEETDRQMGFEGSRYTMGDLEACDDDDDDDEEGRGDGGDGGAVIECTCCVCMVRHKGAAFIPCGHTFCRLCSRELWVQRGNCPLCNGFILEILDIF